MSGQVDMDALAKMLAKDEIRDLVLFYARAVDRRDHELLSDLYTDDAYEDHFTDYRGPTKGFLEMSKEHMPHMGWYSHYICNHLIEVDGDEAEGEVYAQSYFVHDGDYGTKIEEMRCLRYLDKYRRCADGKWRFTYRHVIAEMRNKWPVLMGPDSDLMKDHSYEFFRTRRLLRGPRT